jgi:DNA-binding response OmpR family regulator
VSGTILVAEDDPKQAELVRIYLEREGHRVHVVGDGVTALDRARSSSPDLVILDVMLPGLDGLEVCRTLHRESDVRILMLTARSTEDDVLRGLDLGADDYLTKPFSPRELTARVRALVRRARPAAGQEQVIRAGNIEVDEARFEVRVGGAVVALTPREFAILAVLTREPRRVFSRAQIIDTAFDDDHDVLERVIDAHIVNLRRKLAECPAWSASVETVFGRGYRLAVAR